MVKKLVSRSNGKSRIISSVTIQPRLLISEVLLHSATSSNLSCEDFHNLAQETVREKRTRKIANSKVLKDAN